MIIVERRGLVEEYALKIFYPEIRAGAGLSHIVSKDSRVDSFPSLLVYGMADLCVNYSSRFAWRVSPGAGPRAGMKLSPCGAAALVAELSYMRYPGCGVWQTRCAARYAFSHSAAADISYSLCAEGYDLCCSAVLYF